MSEFIGKFTAPGTGDVGVLGIELTHDFATDTKEGVVRLEKRPYWEGGATLFTLEMPATSERAAMHLTGLWIARGDFDGEGCNVTVTGVTMRSAVPAAPTLDELTDPADIDWGTIRSTCAARDWRAAWGVVGTDHAGDATPGEVYLLAVARRASATAAALVAWRDVFLGPRLAPARRAFDPLNAEHVERQPQFEQRQRKAMTSEAHALDAHQTQWQRIKRIAAWESSAAAQYDERGNRRGRLQAAVRAWRWEFADTTVRPTNMWIDEATLNALRQQAAVIDDPVELDPELYGNGRGVVGVLNNPFLTAAAQHGEITGTVTITASEPVSFDAAAFVESELRHQLGALIGQPITRATRAQAEQIAANVLRDAQRTANPAPRGPQTRKRR